MTPPSIGDDDDDAPPNNGAPGVSSNPSHIPPLLPLPPTWDSCAPLPVAIMVPVPTDCWLPPKLNVPGPRTVIGGVDIGSVVFTDIPLRLCNGVGGAVLTLLPLRLCSDDDGTDGLVVLMIELLGELKLSSLLS